MNTIYSNRQSISLCTNVPIKNMTKGYNSGYPGSHIPSSIFGLDCYLNILASSVIELGAYNKLKTQTN